MGTEQPALAATTSAPALATARDWLAQLPLSMIAWRNRPRAGGEASSAHTDQPPEDSPAIVTRPGSPPNAPMFRRTQRSAASWSSRPKLPSAAALAVLRPGSVRKPNGPTR